MILFSEMADILEGCAVDPSHQPAIYAAFIREIVRKTKEARLVPSSPTSAPTFMPMINGHGNGNGDNNNSIISGTPVDPSLSTPTPVLSTGMYDPQLLGDPNNWPGGTDLMGPEGTQFAFIPQGGDMM